MVLAYSDILEKEIEIRDDKSYLTRRVNSYPNPLNAGFYSRWTGTGTGRLLPPLYLADMGKVWVWHYPTNTLPIEEGTSITHTYYPYPYKLITYNHDLIEK